MAENFSLMTAAKHVHGTILIRINRAIAAGSAAGLAKISLNAPRSRESDCQD
jgi:hypothetical protein